MYNRKYKLVYLSISSSITFLFIISGLVNLLSEIWRKIIFHENIFVNDGNFADNDFLKIFADNGFSIRHAWEILVSASIASAYVVSEYVVSE